MTSDKIYQVPKALSEHAHIKADQYRHMYEQSMVDPDKFWSEQAGSFISWYKKWDKVQQWSFKDKVHIKWFMEGKLNVTYNCLDRHLGKRGDQTAILWESDDPKVDKKITYKQLYEDVCRFANVLKNNGVQKRRSGFNILANDP
jgi:Acyl-coenzyme A synthetases/AMP-(fatty) acid ligases